MKRFVFCCLVSVAGVLPGFTQALDLQLGGAKDSRHAAKGVLVDDNGTLATVAILGTDPRVAVMEDSEGNEVPLKLLAHDVVSRITLLKVPENLREGSVVVKDFGMTGSMTPAMKLRRDLKNEKAVSRMVSRDRRFNGRVLALGMIRVNHGVSGVEPGTPLFGDNGDLLGFTHQGIMGEETTTYALPVEVLKHILAGQSDAADDGLRLVKRCWVGISLDALNDAPIVTGVRPESPARAAGIVKGDVLLSVDGQRVSDYADVVNSFYYLRPKKEVVFKVLRGMDVKSFTVSPEVNPLLAGQGSGEKK